MKEVKKRERESRRETKRGSEKKRTTSVGITCKLTI